MFTNDIYMYEITVTFIQIMIRMYIECSTSGNNDYLFFPSGYVTNPTI